MSLAITYARASVGIHAPLVTVETHITGGFPGFRIVGLAETAVKESKERVRSALMNSQFQFPKDRITVNLGPADLPKSGGRFDLAIAIGILAASKQIPSKELDQYELAGELGLNGELRPIKGAISCALATQKANRNLIISKKNAFEASLSGHMGIYTAGHLLSVCAHFKKKSTLPAVALPTFNLDEQQIKTDLANVRGQEHAKRALEIAASGGHNLLFNGPPGAGKTLLSECLPSILPPLSQEEAIDVGSILSLCGKQIDLKKWFMRPFRAPHHNASAVALVGGGNPPKPGEISLAHNGVLFLDELPEYRRDVLEALREPIESGAITISRANYQETFPAKFQFLAAMNPCPCGYHGSNQQECHCSPNQIHRYQRKISGPLLDRIDMHVNIAPLPNELLLNAAKNTPENSESVRKRIEISQNIQYKRAKKLNNQLRAEEIERHCALDKKCQELIKNAFKKLNLSARGYQRVLRVARTIADLAGAENILEQHIAEALTYRRIERK